MNSENRKYQVFVSSTYEDLQEERQEVIHALLELDCIPSGMELFPAANEDQWTLIKGVIDDCDYYIVIIGGRYGSIGPENISYTEMEYRYALEKNKPIIAFLHKEPDNLPKKKTEKESEGQKKLNEFRAFAQKKMVKYWENSKDLGSVVSRSLIMLQKTHPGVGWVRGDVATSKEASLEILNLKKENERLQNELSLARTTAPEGTETLSQGEDLIELSYSFEHTLGTTVYNMTKTRYRDKILVSWNEIFSSISPLMIDEANEETLESGLDYFIRQKSLPIQKEDSNFNKGKLSDFSTSSDDFQTIKIQLRALGLISKSTKTRSVKDTGTYWTLTPYGDEVMTKLRAIRR